MNKTLKQHAKDALMVLNACNLVGVVGSMYEAAKFLSSRPDCTGTDWVRQIGGLD